MDDKKLIKLLGGAAKVARDLGFDPKSGVQRVHNWNERGIPPRILLDHKDYFDKAKSKAAEDKLCQYQRLAREGKN